MVSFTLHYSTVCLVMLLHEDVQTKVSLHCKRFAISLVPDIGGQLLNYWVINLLQYTVIFPIRIEDLASQS